VTPNHDRRWKKRRTLRARVGRRLAELAARKADDIRSGDDRVRLFVRGKRCSSDP
jgi:hypothetical protein